MQIHLADLGKKFNRDWIFKEIRQDFQINCIYAIRGSNGSGKSTLLKLIAGAELISAGTILYKDASGKDIPLESVYKHLHLTGPYVDLPELLTLRELIQLQKKFNKLELDENDFAQAVALEVELDKQVKNFSSGMKQRLKLGLALLGNAEILLLDEPCSNLDQMGIDLFQKLMHENKKDRIIIIGSNDDANEISLAQEQLNILDFKGK